MRYMDLLDSTATRPKPKPNASLYGTVGTRHDATRLAARHHREDEDSHEFRSIRALMNERSSVCG